MSNFNYQFAITLPDGETTYQYNDSPSLTPDFLDFLEEIDININNCTYSVTKI